MIHGSGTGPSVKGGAGRKNAGRPERLCKRGSLLFIESEPGNEMYVVKSGKIRLLRHDGERVVVVDTVGPGNVIGEMSLLRGEPRNATAQVVEDSVVVAIDEEFYAATMKNIPPWLGGALRSLVKRLVDTLALSGDETVRKGIAGVIRVILLYAAGLDRRDSPEPVIPLGELNETLYHLTGLGDAELENIFMHLILKRMIGITRDDCGGEFLRIKHQEVLELYLDFLRSRQENRPFAGENMSLAAFDLAGFILTTKGLTAGADQNRCVSVMPAALDHEWRLKEKKLPIDQEALKAVAQAPTGDTGGPYIFNLEHLRRLHLIGTWLPIFKEDVKL